LIVLFTDTHGRTQRFTGKKISAHRADRRSPPQIRRGRRSDDIGSYHAKLNLR
jgi:hypothetical protein